LVTTGQYSLVIRSASNCPAFTISGVVDISNVVPPYFIVFPKYAEEKRTREYWDTSFTAPATISGVTFTLRADIRIYQFSAFGDSPDYDKPLGEAIGVITGTMTTTSLSGLLNGRVGNPTGCSATTHGVTFTKR
jgi:hypothetical protein